MGLIKVTTPGPPLAYTQTTASVNRLKLNVLDAKILKTAEVRILPFTNMKHVGINAIIFLPIAELSSSVTRYQQLFSPRDIL